MSAGGVSESEAAEMRLVHEHYDPNAPLPRNYEVAKAALAECVRVDECSSMAKKAAALASYARQVEDKSLENHCVRIKARAIRRSGELLATLPAKARGDRTPTCGAPPPIDHKSQPSERAKAAKAAGMSQRQTVDALRVAKIPEEDFEEAIERANPPTVSELADLGTNRKPHDELEGRDPEEFNRALHVAAAIKSLASMVSSVKPEAIIRGCLPRQYAGLKRNSDSLLAWLVPLAAALENMR
jgi:hypothetical protein